VQNDTYSRILIEPAQNGATLLEIVTGYSNPQMILRHMDELNSLNLRVDINLLIGMTGVEGMSLPTLRAYQSVPRSRGKVTLQCRFTVDNYSVHSKLYLWKESDVAGPAWVGSANYTQNGFGLNYRSNSHHEFMTQIDPSIASRYVETLDVPTVDYDDNETGTRLRLYEKDLRPRRKYLNSTKADSGTSSQGLNEDAPFVLLPLVQTRGAHVGEVHQRSGLNWGQRDGRNPSQAYVPVPQSVAETGFFPERGYYFQLLTDDGDAFVATVAQQGDKAIETPSDNSLLGKYFRYRLGLREDAFVSTEDLLEYGSTAVRIEKLGDDQFLMDFQPGLIYQF